MLLHEAVTAAQGAPSVIRRPNFGRVFILVPKGSRNYLYVGTEGTPSTCIGWEPIVEDITADDWEVIRVEGIEWPEDIPTPVQRTWRRFLERSRG